MYNYDYANPLVTTYTVPGANFVSTAAIDLRVGGPAGKRGRVVAISCAISTAVTVAASSVTVGTVADPDAYALLPIPISSANTVQNADLAIYTDDDNLIPADSIVHIGNSGGSTAGVGEVFVTIAWF